MVKKILYWLPRVICIIGILFISMFAIDAFDSNVSFILKIRNFFVHLIPSYILVGLLVLAWKKELVGGILFIIVGIAFSVLVFQINYRMTQSVLITLSRLVFLTFPFVLVGVLFIVDHYKIHDK